MRKIAIGNSVYVNIDDCTIEIDKIEINSTISTSFNFNIVRDGTTIKTVSFPLSNQTLNAGDYLNAYGINRAGSDVTEEYTAAQATAFKSMTNLNISKGGFTVSLSNENASLKLYYYSNKEIDEQIYVLNKYEELIAVFNKDDVFPIFNPRIKDTQNAESVLTFSISPNNPKWEQIKNPENLYVTEGKVFSTNFEGCFEEFISDSNEDYIAVTAYERQKLLSRRYVKTWNSETGFDGIDTFMVVLLSGGDLPLKNGDAVVTSKYPKGSSGYALEALLYGTGWTVGTCDVEGTFDLETDQLDIYENILKVQEIWGGILVFDSFNKIVHHRDETKWLPYNGYEVKYQKNMQSLERLYNNKIVTKLCPLGESGLNIKSVNNGSEWLTNYSYTDSVLQGIENNPDITDPEQLKRWGERKLLDLCKPRKELTVKAILLYQVEGYELEEIALNHIVDVINFGGSEKDIEQLRVISYDHGVWDYSDAVLELSDITLESTDIFKKTVSATNRINDGTLDSRKVVNFYKNGESISESFKTVDRTIVKTKSELIKSDEEITKRVTQVRTDVNDLSDQVVAQELTITEHTVTIGEIKDRIYDVEQLANDAVEKVDVYYALGTSQTTAPTSGWDTKAPAWQSGKYMWQKTVTTYVNGTTVESDPTNISGASGTDGRGISSVKEKYLASSSNTGVTTSTSGWTDAIQTMTATNKYLWNYEIVTYTDSSTSTTSPRIIGVYGDKGNSGKGISSIVNKYLASTSVSGVTTSTSGWTDTIQTITTEKKYLWNYEIVTYTDGTNYTSTPVIIGVYGNTGKDGLGIKDVVEQYYLSDSDITQTGGEWKKTQDSWEEGKYIWTRTKITWSDNSVTYTNPVLANNLNDMNSDMIVVKETLVEQQKNIDGVSTTVTETTKRLNNKYLTAEQVNAGLDSAKGDIEVLKEKQTEMEQNASEVKIKVNTIVNEGVDKITTSMGYTFNDEGLHINRSNADTGTIIDEAGIQVLDKTGSTKTDVLYAGYVKEGNTKYADYIGQTIVSTTNLIVRNYLVVGNNSRFENYSNPTLGGTGTGAFDI